MKRYLKANAQFHLVGQAVIKYSLLLVLSLSFCGGQYTTLFSTHLPHKGGVLLSSANYPGTFHNPFRQLFLSEPVQEEEDSPDEFGPDDHGTMEWCSLFQPVSFDHNLQFTPQRTLVSELTRSIQNRPAASLFVLHHCWKSFLT